MWWRTRGGRERERDGNAGGMVGKRDGGKQGREVAEEECGLLSEQKRDGERTKGRNKQVKYGRGGDGNTEEGTG